MKILILSNYSDKIASLNELTEPNKQDYADRHGYEFENVKLDYTPENHVKWMEIISERLTGNDVVMTIGCDAIFTNLFITIQEKMNIRPFSKVDKAGSPIMGYPVNYDTHVIIAREHISWWPINNDVMIWPKGHQARFLLAKIIDASPTWLKYDWLWQHYLWNLMCYYAKQKNVTSSIRLVQAREMNSTFQPFSVNKNGEAQRFPGPSSWQLGDWILHALDMPLEQRIQVIKWGLQFVGDGSWHPLPGK